METTDPDFRTEVTRDANELKLIAELDDNSRLADELFQKLFMDGERRTLSQDELLGLEFSFSIFNAAVHQARDADEKIEAEIKALSDTSPSSSESD